VVLVTERQTAAIATAATVRGTTKTLINYTILINVLLGAQAAESIIPECCVT
jgi:hypothetical protein